MTPSAPADKTWIIFCRVVDHFGDAGFCWRLALALANKPAIDQMVLVIDAPDILRKLQGGQRHPRITVFNWESVDQLPKASVVIEAFACNPPRAYLESLQPNASWITLDYLATEPWADNTHGKASPSPSITHPVGGRRRWFNPGFSDQTGGLLHGQWRHLSAAKRRQWRKQLIMLENSNTNSNTTPAANAAANAIENSALDDRVFLVMAFGYPDAPWAEIKALVQQHLPAPFTRAVFWQPATLEYSQAQFDEILQACDLNFVRGEDSFVRAHWAAAGPWQVPFIWQPYRQAHLAHADKLNAWAAQLFMPKALAPLRQMHLSWNDLGRKNTLNQSDLTQDWIALTQHWQQVRLSLHDQCLKLAGKAALEDQLMKFVN